MSHRHPLQVQLVRESSPGLSSETGTLLRDRLRAVVLVLLFALVLFLVRGLLVQLDILTAFRVVALVVMLGCYRLLRSDRELSLPAR